MAADLDDGERLGAGETRAQGRIGKRRRHDREGLVAARQGQARGAGAGHQRRHAGHDLHGAALDKALIEIKERAVEKRIALAQHGDIPPGRDLLEDLVGRAVIDLRLGELAVAERHADGDLLLTAGQMRRHDLAREAVAGFGGRVGDDRRGAQDAQRLQGQQLGIAGADAEAVDGGGHTRTMGCPETQDLPKGLPRVRRPTRDDVKLQVSPSLRVSPRRKPGSIFQRPVCMDPGFRRGDSQDLDSSGTRRRSDDMRSTLHASASLRLCGSNFIAWSPPVASRACARASRCRRRPARRG